MNKRQKVERTHSERKNDSNHALLLQMGRYHSWIQERRLDV